jgi:hypothetical protein
VAIPHPHVGWAGRNKPGRAENDGKGRDAERERKQYHARCIRLAQSDNVLHDSERSTLADIHRRMKVEVPIEFISNRR